MDILGALPAVVVGAGITAAVAILLHLSAGRREAKRWRLDKKYEAYVAFLKAMDRAEEGMLQLAEEMVSDGGRVRDRRLPTAATKELQLVGRPSVRRMIMKWNNRYLSCAEILAGALVRCGPADFNADDEYRKAKMALWARSEDVFRYMRWDLGTGPVPSVPRPARGHARSYLLSEVAPDGTGTLPTTAEGKTESL